MKLKILNINNDSDINKLKQSPEMIDAIDKFIPIIADILLMVNNNLPIYLTEKLH
jgi:hypothetical protein